MKWAFDRFEFMTGRYGPRLFWTWRAQLGDRQWCTVYLWRLVIAFKTVPGSLTRFFQRRREQRHVAS
jgi:hypothetical protein